MQDTDIIEQIAEKLERIARVLEASAANRSSGAATLTDADAFHWQPRSANLRPVPVVNAVPLFLLRGLDSVLPALMANTEQFARGHGANNALLWGARGMGKSSAVKAVHADIAARADAGFKRLVLVEINREDRADVKSGGLHRD